MPLNFWYINKEWIKVINVLYGIRSKELILIEQTKGKSLKGLIKQLEYFLASDPIRPFGNIPLKQIPGIIELILLHLLSIHPNASLNKMNLNLLRVLKLHRKPIVRQSLDLIDEFEQRTFLQQVVAYPILDFG